ncbi:MAG: FKBP-type peptidyl-prolyl cis-trans isomerase [Bacteroidales bacterium]|nr:FKBP-type peptidyl-prolyl cis-trans isomerase [Bacteroidales bacterium]
MNISKNTVAFLTYTLKDHASGQLIEKITSNEPQAFIFGTGQLIPGFEDNLIGMQSGSNFEFVIPCVEAYGERDPNAVFDIPKDTFEVDGMIVQEVIRIGNHIPMRDDYGNKHVGRVIEHKRDEIVMDFNHPLAGKDLLFSGEVLQVREAFEEELNMPEGCSCGGNCGCKGEHAHQHSHEGSENCQVCGNPAELQGQGIGDCKCS